MLLLVNYCGLFNSQLEECLALKQRAEHAKSHFFTKRSKVRKVNHAFLPEGIQIEDLTQASCMPCLVSQLALLAELFVTTVHTSSTKEWELYIALNTHRRCLATPAIYFHGYCVGIFIILEECLSLQQQAEHAKSQF